MGPATVILGFLLTNGHLVALVVSAVLLFPSQLLERSPLANEQQWMPDQLQQEVLNHGCEKFFKKNWTLPNVQVTKAVKKIRALCPELVSKDRGDGGVDLWISLTKQMQQLQQQQLELVEAAVRHKHKAAEQEERAIEIGKSISQIRRRLTNTAKESEAKVLDEKSLDFADDETKKAYQDALKLERAAAKRVAEIAEAARTMQMERKRAAQTEACVAMEEDTKVPASKEEDDEVKQLLAKVSKEAEQRAYLAGPAAERKTRSRRTRVSRVPDTRKILFQNVTSFGHKARTWLLSDQMDYDIMGVAEHHLDLASAAEERGTARFGHLPVRQAVEEPVGEPWQ